MSIISIICIGRVDATPPQAFKELLQNDEDKMAMFRDLFNEMKIKNESNS